MISKNIFQTWYTKNLPSQIKHSIDEMIDINGEYDYFIYDDDDMYDFVKKEYGYSIYKRFLDIKIGAMRADIWRYMILYKYGGVYLDIDSILYGKISDLNNKNSSIITRERNPGLFVQWMLLFDVGHPILHKCIEKCIENINKVSIYDVTQLTGPHLFTSCVNDFFGDKDIYFKSDEEISSAHGEKNTLVYSYDFDGYANYYHPQRKFLYESKIYWRDEQKIIYGI
jgi:mannosyltransferase OCH1-like enzyme